MNKIVNWPQQVSEEVKMKCIRDYFTNSAWCKPAACAVCRHDRFGIPCTSYQLQENDELPVGFRSILNILRRSIHHGKPDFIFGHSAINNMMLCAKGIHVSEDCKLTMNVCDHCNACLVPNTRNKGATPKLPKYALANKLHLGRLPEKFNDLTWVEEQVCALHRSTIFVYWLYHSDDPQDPYMAKGNSCAHPQNTVSTAKILPCTLADVAGSISIVFTGPNQTVPSAALKNIFCVCKNVVRNLLQWLQANNPLYRDVIVSEEQLSLYGEDGDDPTLPGIAEHVLMNECTKSDNIFDTETSGFEAHPAQPDSTLDKHVPQDVFIEHTGVYDADNTMMPIHQSLASGLQNLKRDANTPDLIISHGNDAIPEYNNPTLFPGMFPSLFPYGLGGFDDNTREVPISFQKHVEYLLDLANRRFRYHRSFLFVALNIHQQYTVYLHTWLTVLKSRFDHVAPKLVMISAERLQQVANHIEKDGKITDLSAQDQEVMTLMKEVTAISSNIPRSSASKLRVRNEIRSYMGYFGLLHLYITMNNESKCKTQPNIPCDVG